ncbi:hypothetical protein PCL_03574 [Purpureocillium lilacinum]|uniref:Uncharacterized protein n=1 Tax=Purpureocillium lilacinum TaxID=33203 RepID=A0A2U3EPI1_PURLI|nr:hypothetical protein PCL_03574 [Purpureocillium lilacinum]
MRAPVDTGCQLPTPGPSTRLGGTRLWAARLRQRLARLGGSVHTHKHNVLAATAYKPMREVRSELVVRPEARLSTWRSTTQSQSQSRSGSAITDTKSTAQRAIQRHEQGSGPPVGPHGPSCPAHVQCSSERPGGSSVQPYCGDIVNRLREIPLGRGKPVTVRCGAGSGQDEPGLGTHARDRDRDWEGAFKRVAPSACSGVGIGIWGRVTGQRRQLACWPPGDAPPAPPLPIARRPSIDQGGPGLVIADGAWRSSGEQDEPLGPWEQSLSDSAASSSGSSSPERWLDGVADRAVGSGQGHSHVGRPGASATLDDLNAKKEIGRRSQSANRSAALGEPALPDTSPASLAWEQGCQDGFAGSDT